MFDVLHIVRLNLDKILEVNQIDITINQDDEREVYDCIEGHLIKCVSVLCNAIKSNHPRIKNVIIIYICVNKLIDLTVNISLIFLRFWLGCLK